MAHYELEGEEEEIEWESNEMHFKERFKLMIFSKSLAKY